MATHLHHDTHREKRRRGSHRRLRRPRPSKSPESAPPPPPWPSGRAPSLPPRRENPRSRGPDVPDPPWDAGGAGSKLLPRGLGGGRRSRDEIGEGGGGWRRAGRGAEVMAWWLPSRGLFFYISPAGSLPRAVVSVAAGAGLGRCEIWTRPLAGKKLALRVGPMRLVSSGGPRRQWRSAARGAVRVGVAGRAPGDGSGR